MNEEELKKLLEEHSSSIKSELSKSSELAIEMKKDFEEFKANVEEKLESLGKTNEDNGNTESDKSESSENNENESSSESSENEDSKKLEARNNAINLRAQSNLGNSSDIAKEVAKSVFGENMIAK